MPFKGARVNGYRAGYPVVPFLFSVSVFASGIPDRPGSRGRNGVVTSIRVFAEGNEGLRIFILQEDDAVLGLPRLAIVHEMVQGLGDMVGKAGLNGDLGVFGADEESKRCGTDDSVILSVYICHYTIVVIARLS